MVTSWVSRSTTPEIYDEEEDPCTICHEEMKPGTTKMLECKHYFHDRVSETLYTFLNLVNFSQNFLTFIFPLTLHNSSKL